MLILLIRIIKIRRQQSNFQLIVITHDEEFMQALGRNEFCDHYWRMRKDEKFVNPTFFHF